MGRSSVTRRLLDEKHVRDHYDRVKVPVFTLSGWQDGYRNVTERQVRALGELGRPVAGLIGPWGHKYPFDGYPGPRIDWLRYVVRHWWDRWLKGSQPDPAEAWPELVVWLGESRLPARIPSFEEAGRWVAEDHDWMSRTREKTLYLWPGNRLLHKGGAPARDYVSHPDIMLGTSALETSSWGECMNDDLPGDTGADDRRSISLDSDPVEQDFACFGYPGVELNLECDKPVASLAIRLCEVSPDGSSRLVTYTFLNLCARSGDMANPEVIPGGPFAVSAKLNLIGHVFKRGWRLRLSISPFYFPTLWASPEIATIRLKTGQVGDLAESRLILPGREKRAEDERVQRLITAPRTAFVGPEQYVPTVKTIRTGSSTREASPVTVGGRSGTQVRKVFDYGSVVYGGALDNLLVDQRVEEDARIFDGDPLSAIASSRSESKLERGEWKVRTLTRTRIWSERIGSDKVVFHYEAEARAFIGDVPFEERHVEGTIPRRWV
jgi:predicted acyl esterase